MASTFDWVKPYDDNNNPIFSGAGHLSDSNGYPLNWKLEYPNYGRLKRRATYLFETNEKVFTGEGNSKATVIKTATLQQHGLSIFKIDKFDLTILDNTIVFNLADSSVIDGTIGITEDAFTNALFFEIHIAPAGNDDVWPLGRDTTFTQVSWADSIPAYFNKIREKTYYRFLVNRPEYYGAEGTYLEEDPNNLEGYTFKMVYNHDGNKISTGNYNDIIEYFDDDLDVVRINFNNLNSDLLEFTDNNNVSRTFKAYYNNLLTIGERNKFRFLFYTDVNPVIKDISAFMEFSSSLSTTYISSTEMLHFTITITPRGYKLKVEDITPSSNLWDYLPCIINVYIINCRLDPYLYLYADGMEEPYVSDPLNANGDTIQMPVFSNRGWDITPSGTTDYIGY